MKLASVIFLNDALKYYFQLFSKKALHKCGALDNIYKQSEVYWLLKQLIQKANFEYSKI